jgi:hypothetical protein
MLHNFVILFNFFKRKSRVAIGVACRRIFTAKAMSAKHGSKFPVMSPVMIKIQTTQLDDPFTEFIVHHNSLHLWSSFQFVSDGVQNLKVKIDIIINL